MTSRQFSEWMLYEKLEPFGPVAANINAAKLEAALYNVNRAKKETPVVRWQDVALGDFGETRDWRQTPEEQRGAMKALAIAFGAEIRE